MTRLDLVYAYIYTIIHRMKIDDVLANKDEIKIYWPGVHYSCLQRDHRHTYVCSWMSTLHYKCTQHSAELEITRDQLFLVFLFFIHTRHTQSIAPQGTLYTLNNI